MLRAQVDARIRSNIAESRTLSCAARLAAAQAGVGGGKGIYRIGWMMSLFDNLKRTDVRNKDHSESVFAFLNRSAQPRIALIRDLLESWFERVPDNAKNSLRGRLQGDDPHFYGASFELLVHELLTRLGCSVDVLDIDGEQARPDFFVQNKKMRCYLETTVVDPKSSPFAPNPLEEDVIAKINTLNSPDFYIWAEARGRLSKNLRKTKVVEPFRALLEAHDPDAVHETIDAVGLTAAPSKKIEWNGWSIQGWLCPLPKEKRGDGKARTLVIGPARAEGVDPSTPVKRAVLEKAHKYGRLNAPLVVAVNSLDFFFNCRDDELEALFGKEQITYIEDSPAVSDRLTREPHGIWVERGYQPRYTRLNGVMIFRNIAPWDLSAPVCLYLNPFVDNTSIPQALYRLAYAVGKDGKINWFQGTGIDQLLDNAAPRQGKSGMPT